MIYYNTINSSIHTYFEGKQTMKKEKNVITNEFLIKRLKKIRRKLFFSMIHIKWTIVFLISAFVCFIGSFILEDYNTWVSSLLQSIGCSIIAGWVMYIISNKRIQSERYLNTTVESFSKLNDYAHKIYFTYPLVSTLFTPLNNDKQSFIERVYEVLEYAEEYTAEIYKLKYSIYRKMMDSVNMDVDIMKKELRLIRSKIPEEVKYQEGKEIVTSIIKIIEPCANYVHEKLNNAKIQKRQLEEYPL